MAPRCYLLLPLDGEVRNKGKHRKSGCVPQRPPSLWNHADVLGFLGTQQFQAITPWTFYTAQPSRTAAATLTLWSFQLQCCMWQVVLEMANLPDAGMCRNLSLVWFLKRVCDLLPLPHEDLNLLWDPHLGRWELQSLQGCSLLCHLFSELFASLEVLLWLCWRSLLGVGDGLESHSSPGAPLSSPEALNECWWRQPLPQRKQTGWWRTGRCTPLGTGEWNLKGWVTPQLSNWMPASPSWEIKCFKGTWSQFCLKQRLPLLRSLLVELQKLYCFHLGKVIRSPNFLLSEYWPGCHSACPGLPAFPRIMKWVGLKGSLKVI